VVIETDLSHRDHTRMARELTQLAPFGGTDRLPPPGRGPGDGRSQSPNSFGQLDTGLVVRGVVANVQNGLDAGCPRLLQRLLRRRRLAQVQEMGVGIDQATGSGFSM